MTNEVDGVCLPSPVTDIEVTENKEYISPADKTVPCEPVMKHDIEAINTQEYQTTYFDGKETTIDFEANRLDKNVDTDKLTLVTQTHEEPLTKREQQVVEDSDTTEEQQVEFDEHISVERIDDTVSKEHAPEELPLQEAIGTAEQQEDTVKQTALVHRDEEEVQADKTVTVTPTETEQAKDVSIRTKTEIVTETVKEEAEQCELQSEKEPQYEITEAPLLVSQEETATEVQDTTTITQADIVQERTEQQPTVTESVVTTTTVVKQIQIPISEREQVQEEIPRVDFPGEMKEVVTAEQKPVIETDAETSQAEKITAVTATEADDERDVSVVSEAEIEAVAEAKEEMEEQKAEPEEPVEATTVEVVQHEAVQEELEEEIQHKVIEESQPVSQDEVITKVEDTTTLTEAEVVVVTAVADVESYKPVSKEDVEQVMDQPSEAAEEPVVSVHEEEKVEPSESEAIEMLPLVAIEPEVQEKEDIEVETDILPVMEKQKLQPEVTAAEVSPIETADEKAEPQEIVEEPVIEQSTEEHVTVTETVVTTTTVAREIQPTTPEHEQIREEIPPADFQGELDKETETFRQKQVVEAEGESLKAEEINQVTATEAEDAKDVSVVNEAEIAAVAETKEELAEQKAEPEQPVEGTTVEVVQHETVEDHMAISQAEVLPSVDTEPGVQEKEDTAETEEFVEETPAKEQEDETLRIDETSSERPPDVEGVAGVTKTEIVTVTPSEVKEPCKLQPEEELGEEIHHEVIEESLPVSQDEVVTKGEDTTTVTEAEVVVVTAVADVESYKPVSKEDVEQVIDQPSDAVEEPVVSVHEEEKAEPSEESDILLEREEQKLEPEVSDAEISPSKTADKKVEPEEVVQVPVTEQSTEEHVTVTETVVTTTTVVKEIQSTTPEREQIGKEIPPVDIERDEELETVEQKSFVAVKDESLQDQEIVTVAATEAEDMRDVSVVSEAEIEAVAEGKEEMEEQKAEPEEPVEATAVEVEHHEAVEEELEEAIQHEVIEESLPVSQDKVLTKVDDTTTLTEAEVVVVTAVADVESYKPVSKEDVEQLIDQPSEAAEEPVVSVHEEEKVERSEAEAIEQAIEIESDVLPVMEEQELEPQVTAAEVSAVETADEKVEPEEIVEEPVTERSTEEHVTVTETVVTTITVVKEIQSTMPEYEQSEVESLEDSRDETKSITMVQVNQEIDSLKPHSFEAADVMSQYHAGREVKEIEPKMEVEKKTEFTAEAECTEHEDLKLDASSAVKEVEPSDVVDKELELMKPVLEQAQAEVEEAELMSSVVEHDVAIDEKLLQLEQTVEPATAAADAEIETLLEEQTELTQKSTDEQFEKTDETRTQSTVAYEITTAKVRIEEREEVTETSSEGVEPFVLQAPEAESSVSEEVHDESTKAVAGDQISDEELESDLELLLEESRIKYDISRSEVNDPLLELLPQDVHAETTLEETSSREKVVAGEEMKLVQEEGTLIAEGEVPAELSVKMTEITESETQAETEEISADLQAVSSSMVEEMLLKVSQRTLIDDTGIVYPQILSSETETFDPTDSENAEHRQLTEKTVAEDEDSQEHDYLVKPGKEGKLDAEGVETHTSAVDELSTSEEMIENDYTSDASIVMQLHAEETLTEAQPGSEEPGISTAMRFEPDKVVHSAGEVECSDTSLHKEEPTEKSLMQRGDKMLSDEAVEAVVIADVGHTPLDSEDLADDSLEITVVTEMKPPSPTDDSKDGIHEVAASLVTTIVKIAGELESSEKLSHDRAELQRSRDVSAPQTLDTEGGRSTVMQVVRTVKPDGEIVEQIVSVDSASAVEALGALPSPQTSLCGESGEELEPPAMSSAVIVYADTVEERPDSETEMTEYEEFLPDGTLVRRKVVKTTRHEAVTRRVVVEEDDQLSTQFEASPAFLRYSDRAEEGPMTVTLKDETFHDTLSDGRSVVTHSTVTSQQKLVMERTFVDALDISKHADLETVENLLSYEPSGIFLTSSSRGK